MPSGPEQRRFPRRRTSAVVRIDSAGTMIEAVIKDISEGGVGLLLRSGDTLADSFTIEVKPNQWRRAEIVWRGYPRCGAVFRD